MGGTQGIWKSVAALVPDSKFQFTTTLVNVNTKTKTATMEDGRQVRYTHLINTSPLDTFVQLCTDLDPFVVKTGKSLHYSTTHVIGLGMRGVQPNRIGETCWSYFPEPDCPFYRATMFSNYSPFVVPAPETNLETLFHADTTPPLTTDPRPGPYWSLIFEVSESQYKQVDVKGIIASVLQGCINTTLLEGKDEIVSVYHQVFPHGYPTPHLDRDKQLEVVLPALKTLGILSRGRFGAYKYEVANQDHSFMQGVEAAEYVMNGTPEATLFYPSRMNAKRNPVFPYPANHLD